MTIEQLFSTRWAANIASCEREGKRIPDEDERELAWDWFWRGATAVLADQIDFGDEDDASSVEDSDS